MNKKAEILFAFDKGVLTAVPEISSQEFYFSKLENFLPVFNRLKLFRAHSIYTIIPEGETIRAIATYLNLSTQILQGYIITETRAYRLSSINAGGILTIDGEPLTIDGEELVIEYSNTQFQGDLLQEFPQGSSDLVSWVSWDDTSTVYFSRKNLPLTKIQDDVVSEVSYTYNDGVSAVGLSAKYLLISQNRLFMANITTSKGDLFSRRLQWSDLYNPEDFEINRSKESDFFDLENNNLEITGIHEHRGYPVIFSRQSIWRAVYVRLPEKYRFEIVRNTIGNVYHHSSVNARERIYFVSDDNFYVMDGFSIIPIGDPIWKSFIEINETSIFEEMLAFHDPFQSEVAWKFLRTGFPEYADYRQDTHYWLIVYNYKEERWSFRSADGMTCYNVNRYPVRTSVSMDNIDTRIDDMEELIDGAWQDTSIPSTIMIGRGNQLGLYQQGQFIDKDDAPLIGEIESHELFYNSIMESKEISEFKLSYSATGNPSIKVSVGYRNNQLQDYQWTPEYEEQSITGENEIRFLLNTVVRAKYFKVRITIINDAENFFEELNGGALYLSGMKSSGTEI